MLSLVAAISNELDGYERTWIFAGENIMGALFKSVTKYEIEAKENGAEIANSFALGLNNKAKDIEKCAKTIVVMFLLQPIQGYYKEFETAGSFCVDGFIKGAVSKVNEVDSVGSLIGTTIASSLRRSLGTVLIHL